MKTFVNKSTEIIVDDVAKTYFDLVRDCLDQTPQQGFSFDDLRKRGRIEKALDAEPKQPESEDTEAPGQVELEDADAVNLKSIVKQMRWGVRHPDLIDFGDAINAL